MANCHRRCPQNHKLLICKPEAQTGRPSLQRAGRYRYHLPDISRQQVQSLQTITDHAPSLRSVTTAHDAFRHDPNPHRIITLSTPDPATQHCYLLLQTPSNQLDCPSRPSPPHLTMSAPTPEETISYPSIALVLALGFVLYRYFFASQSPSTPSSSTPTRNNGLRFTPAQVDQVSAMFPQLSRRDIMWDLQRNRGSVQGTIERVLGGGRLDAVSTPLTFCERNALLG